MLDHTVELSARERPRAAILHVNNNRVDNVRHRYNFVLPFRQVRDMSKGDREKEEHMNPRSGYVVVKVIGGRAGGYRTREMLVMCPASKWIGNFDRRRATKSVKVPLEREERIWGARTCRSCCWSVPCIGKRDLKTAERQWIVRPATHRSGKG
jgi:hypothetical protein